MERHQVGLCVQTFEKIFFIKYFLLLFRLQWNGAKLDCVSELINRPDLDLEFLIEEWDEADLQ